MLFSLPVFQSFSPCCHPQRLRFTPKDPSAEAPGLRAISPHAQQADAKRCPVWTSSSWWAVSLEMPHPPSDAEAACGDGTPDLGTPWSGMRLSSAEFPILFMLNHLLLSLLRPSNLYTCELHLPLQHPCWCTFLYSGGNFLMYQYNFLE